MLSTHQLIQNTGLRGFAPAGDGNLALFLASLLALIDIYLIWHFLLLVIGVRSGNGFTLGKSIGGVLLTLLLVILLQVFLGFLSAKLGGLTIVRPFF
jgi:hypothetical protein